MRKQLIALTLVSMISQLTFAAEVSIVSINRASGGMATEFKNQKMPASPHVIPLPNKSLIAQDRRIINDAEVMFDKNSVLSIVMVERGQLVFEKYRSPASAQRPNFSWSMSKSLTAYTIGAMSCDGQIPDLNKPAQAYASVLSGTVYGEATVKNLLTMSSGVRDAPANGNQLVKTSNCTQGIDCDGWQMQRSQQLSSVDLIKMYPDRDTAWGSPVVSGSRFSYNAVDTLSLSIVADASGGFIKNFTQSIWNPAGTESPGYWLLDKENRAIAQAGLSVTSRDWARLAMFAIRKSKDNDCMGNFMRDATKEQLPNSSRRVGKAFTGYGYQTWIADFAGRKSYWWVGYGGQRVGIEPESERIIVLTSWREDYMGDVYKLFGNWTK